jgi:hypothetical protein
VVNCATAKLLLQLDLHLSDRWSHSLSNHTRHRKSQVCSHGIATPMSLTRPASFISRTEAA